MPDRVTETLRAERLLVTIGPHVPNTVRRRLSSWATPHHWKGGPFASPHLRAAIRLSVRAAARPRTRKSKRAVTRDVLEQALASCAGDRLVDLRDRALLLLAFASGGRRCSEVSRLKVEQLTDEPPVPRDPADPTAGKMPCLSITLGRTKTAQADDDQRVLLIGTPVEVLRAWQERAGISRGFLFRAIDRWGNLEKRALTPQSVNLIVKRRLGEAGLDPKGVQRSRPALRLFDRSLATRRPAARGDAAVAASIGATSGELLQRRRTTAGASGALDRVD